MFLIFFFQKPPHWAYIHLGFLPCRRRWTNRFRPQFWWPKSPIKNFSYRRFPVRPTIGPFFNADTFLLFFLTGFTFCGQRTPFQLLYLIKAFSSDSLFTGSYQVLYRLPVLYLLYHCLKILLFLSPILVQIMVEATNQNRSGNRSRNSKVISLPSICSITFCIFAVSFSILECINFSACRCFQRFQFPPCWTCSMT